MRQAKATKHPAGEPPRRSTTPKRTAGDPLRPRKLPRQQRAAATVSAILEAAACILESGGLDAYTTNAIAERAGASIGSLYQYFPNNDALTRSLMAREDAALFEALVALLGHPPGEPCLRALVRVAVNHQMARPALARYLDAQETRLPATDESKALMQATLRVLERGYGLTLLLVERNRRFGDQTGGYLQLVPELADIAVHVNGIV